MKTPPILGRLFRRTTPLLVEMWLEDLTKDMESYLIKRIGKDYMWRYYPEGKKTEERDKRQFGWYIHKFVGSDSPDEVHSHPWAWCFSIILSGEYLEIRYKWSLSPDGKKVLLRDGQTKIFRPYMMNTIMHEDMHSVQLVDAKPVYTLFVYGPRASTWGFADIKTGNYREILKRTAERTD